MANSDNQSTPTPPPSQTDPVADAKKIAELEQELNTIAAETKQEVLDDPAFGQTLATTLQMQDIVIDVERELLYEIVKRLELNEISQEKAQELAKEFLSFLPIQDQHDLLTKLKKLSGENTEAQGIYLKYVKPYEEDESKKKIELMSQHLKDGNIEQALSIVKGGVQNG